MKTQNRWGLIAVILSLLSACLTVYTYEAYTIANSRIIEWNGEIWWRTTPSGSLFPWPREPGMLQALSKVNGTDLFFYIYLIRSFALVMLSALMWVFAALSMLKFYNKLKQGTFKPRS